MFSFFKFIGELIAMFVLVMFLTFAAYVWVNVGTTVDVVPVHECSIPLSWPPRQECKVVGFELVAK